MALSQDQKSAFKLAQILQCINDLGNIASFEKILEKEGDINYAIPRNSSGFRALLSSGSTAIHVAYGMKRLKFFHKLLEIGADFTKKNYRGQTVLHMMVHNPKRISRPLYSLSMNAVLSAHIKSNNTPNPLDLPSINAVLSAHIKSNNITNPYDNRGLSHFHIACMINNSAAVQFFLDNGISVDEPVLADAELLPGYTPLHLAAIYTNIKIAEILLANGANMHAIEVSGMSVLHTLIKHRVEMFDSIGETLNIKKESYKHPQEIRKENDIYEQLQKQINENEILISMLMENMSSDNDGLDHIGLSNIHVACMLHDSSAAQHLMDHVTDLDHSLNADSPLWPGYTALHFAAHVSLNNVEMLVKKGANLGKPDSAGITPLDICIERYKIEDVCHIMSLNTDWANIKFSDGRTNLLSFLHSFSNRNQFKRLIDRSIYEMNMFVPMESLLWPRFTPLHLAVRFAEKSKPMFKENEKEVDLQIIRLCLKNGSDLRAQDSQGRTALHLAYRLKKTKVVDVILRHSHEIPNAFDEDNLSHLHIICAVSKTMNTFKKCVINDSNVNAVYRGTSPILDVRPGSTPLHVCLVNTYRNDVYELKIKELLKYTANPNIKDAYGLTPIHWLLNTYSAYGMKIDPLLQLVENDCVVEEYGISYLHVACHMKDTDTVMILLENGANINSIIGFTEQNLENPLFFLSGFHKRSPFSMLSYDMSNLANLLIDKGADVYSEIVSVDDVTMASQFRNRSIILKALWNNIELQTRVRQEFGWTKLHLACCTLVNRELEDTVREELADVNAKIHPNSPFWKGYTPLHLLRNNISMENLHLVSEILLENGADVTVMNDQQNTPITMLFEHPPGNTVRLQAAWLMKYHRDYKVNPVNSNGLSHFHLACWLNDVNAVRGFLSHSVEVNRPIGYFADWSPGCTPLHLTTNFEIVDLLINHGADINIEDVHGHTALHKAVKRDAFDGNIIKRIIDVGANVNSFNYKGETPVEVAFSSGLLTMDQLRFFIRQGFIVNSCNPISGVGYIGIASGHYYQDRNTQSLVVETIMNERPTNIFGRTTLHCLVTINTIMQSGDYDLLIEKIIKSGCDIDEQDNDGKTALHLAVKLQFSKTVHALLKRGADINILDKDGNSALSCASIFSPSRVTESESVAYTLITHACRLAFLKLDLSHSNKDTISRARKYLQDSATNQNFRQKIVITKGIELGVRSMRLSDFLSETGAVAAYHLLDELERSKIDEYFESIHNDDDLTMIEGLLKLQYRKAVKRAEIYSSAIFSFSSVLGFNLPYLCAENIFLYLNNSDLQNIISARIDVEDTSMDVDL